MNLRIGLNRKTLTHTPGATAVRGLRWPGWGLMGWLGLGLATGAHGQTRYQLVEGSVWTPAGERPSLAVRGGFRLVPLPRPLNWDSYRVEGVRLEAESAGGQPRIWRGSGLYQRGGRGPFFGHQMWLELDDGGGPMQLDSGLVPVSGPELDLTLTTGLADGPSLRLKAVAVLERWTYRLVAESQFLDGCMVCRRGPLPVPLKGSFELVHTGGNPLFERYHVLGLRLSDGAEPPGVVITGEGTVEIGGEVTLQQKWNLTLRVRTGGGERTSTFLDGDSRPQRLWPMLGAELEEDGGNEFSRFFVNLRAAPFRELWFTTHSGMTPGVGTWPDQRLSGADLLSDTGRLVVPGAQLLKPAGLSPEVGVDGFDVIPGSGGVIAYSIGQAADSPTLGQVSEGDLLSSEGRVLRRNVELLARMGFMPPTPQLGLDAVFWHESGEVWFSVRESAWSEKIGQMVGRGDVLSSAGRVVRSHADLLARFTPENPQHDYGLDAFYVWPSGEIWFSVEEGFLDAQLGSVTDGDLLSDQGYIVARNLDLVQPFRPLEDLANFGLEGLWVVSDAVPPAGAPKFQPVRRLVGGLELSWTGPGRVFQLEHTARLDDPFVPLSPILPAGMWEVPPTLMNSPAGLFRLRGW